jgi:hypothetical protein
MVYHSERPRVLHKFPVLRVFCVCGNSQESNLGVKQQSPVAILLCMSIKLGLTKMCDNAWNYERR